VVEVGVVAHPEEGLGVAAGEFSIQVWGDGDLVLPADDGEDAADRRISEGGVDVFGPASGVAPTSRVVGYSTGTRPVTSVSRRMACSCTAGKAPAAANDGESTAM
jgi:hypothetical protein